MEKLLARLFGHTSVLYVYGESLCVFMQEAEMGAASKEAAVMLSCAVNCACVCVCAFASLCTTVWMFVLGNVCR